MDKENRSSFEARLPNVAATTDRAIDEAVAKADAEQAKREEQFSKDNPRIPYRQKGLFDGVDKGVGKLSSAFDKETRKEWDKTKENIDVSTRRAVATGIHSAEESFEKELKERGAEVRKETERRIDEGLLSYNGGKPIPNLKLSDVIVLDRSDIPIASPTVYDPPLYRYALGLKDSIFAKRLDGKRPHGLIDTVRVRAHPACRRFRRDRRSKLSCIPIIAM